MNINQLRQSKYLKQTDFDENGLILTVASAGIETVGSDEGEEDKLVTHFHELEKGLVTNITNAELIAEIAGSFESDDWGGTLLVLFCDPSIRFGRKKTGGLRIRELSPDEMALVAPPVKSQPVQRPAQPAARPITAPAAAAAPRPAAPRPAVARSTAALTRQAQAEFVTGEAEGQQVAAPRPVPRPAAPRPAVARVAQAQTTASAIDDAEGTDLGPQTAAALPRAARAASRGGQITDDPDDPLPLDDHDNQPAAQTALGADDGQDPPPPVPGHPGHRAEPGNPRLQASIVKRLAAIKPSR